MIFSHFRYSFEGKEPPLQTSQAQIVFQQTYNYVRETALLESTLALLEWDERTGLPAHAGEHRAEQVTFLSGLVHQRKTSPQFGDWLSELALSELAMHPNSPVGASIRGMKRDFDKTPSHALSSAAPTTCAQIRPRSTG